MARHCASVSATFAAEVQGEIWLIQVGWHPVSAELLRLTNQTRDFPCHNCESVGCGVFRFKISLFECARDISNGVLRWFMSIPEVQLGSCHCIPSKALVNLRRKVLGG